MYTCLYCSSRARYRCTYRSDVQYTYCSQRCQLRHAQRMIAAAHREFPYIGAEASDTVDFSSTRLTRERAEQLVSLLNDTQDDQKTRQATDLFSSWFRLPRVPVFFFDSEEVKDADGRVLNRVARQVTVNGRTITLDQPSSRLGNIRNAATDGRSIFVNQRIRTPEFQRNTLRFIRFPVPKRVVHYTAIMVHEYGHVVHIQPRTRSLLDGLWLSWVQRQNDRMPQASAFAQFVEEVADRFAVSVFALLDQS